MPAAAEGVDRIAAVLGAVTAEVRKAVMGQDTAIDQVAACLLAGGHVLLEGFPGTAKTLMARAFARAVQGTFTRVQFTPDLMPADITGTSVFNPDRRQFEFRPGPVFTDLLLADEINRAPAKTQAALLEAMQERRVTADGVSHALSPIFTTIATQNPIEYEGTYPLPEAQLDRFMLKVLVPYPEAEEERAIVARYRDGILLHELDPVNIEPKTSVAEVGELRALVHRVIAEDPMVTYITSIVRQTRNWPAIAVGASPRAGVSLLLVSKAFAALRGRGFITPDDVKGIAPAVLRHRVLLKPESEIEGVKSDDAIRDLLQTVKVPK